MQELVSPTRLQTQCTVCGTNALEEALALPKFPFTGIYCSSDKELDDYLISGVDQGLHYCANCGHAQLKNVVDPRLVYDSTYSHRGSLSSIARQGNECFSKFLSRLFPTIEFKHILDIGCNDGYLLRLLEERSQKLTGIDPIWGDNEHVVSEKITLKGGFVEDFDLQRDIGDPDLIVSAHTFEHVDNPRKTLESILSHVKNGTKVVIEVPSFDTLVDNNRFDQVFHQHIHYFSACSMHRMIQELDCTYIAHAYNYQMWGGTMLFAFTKGAYESNLSNFEQISQEKIKKSFGIFKNSLSKLSTILCTLANESLYGFGAAQMLPSLMYHIPNELSNLLSILDDNPERQGKKFPGAKHFIESPSSVDLTNSSVVVTALDSARPIVAKLATARVKKIILPLSVL